VTTATRTELLKIRTTRLVLGVFGVAAGLTILGAVISAFRAGGTGSNAIPSLSTETGLGTIVSFTGFGLLMALILGITVASGEYRHRTATDTYLDEPNRGRVLIAKAIAGATAGVLLGLAISAIATGIGLAFAIGKGYDIALSASTIARFAAGATLGCALLAAIGVGLGSLLRSQLAAIIAAFVWALAIEQIGGGISDSLAAYLPITAASTMAGATSTGAMPPIPSGLDPLPFGAVAALLAATAALISIVAARTTVRRDVT
jgi:ABC-type transport system involved in multi-copper enzyme maturation permease subunit